MRVGIADRSHAVALRRLGVDRLSGRGRTDLGVVGGQRPTQTDRRRHSAVVQLENGFNQGDHARVSQLVSDLSADRADPEGLSAVSLPVQLDQQTELPFVRGAVRQPGALQHGHLLGPQPGARQRPGGGFAPSAVRTLDVGRAAQTSNDGQNAVAVPFGVGQPFQNQHARSFARHDAADVCVERRRRPVGGQQAPQPQRLVGRHVHGSLAAGTQHHVRSPQLQQVDRGVQGGQSGGVRRVNGKGSTH